MKNLAVVILFLFTLVGVLHSVKAQARSQVRVEPDQLTAPVKLDCEGAIAADKKKKKKKDGDKDEDEESEEDYRALSAGAAALQLVDPGAFDLAVRLEAAARRK